jgi:plasmid stabilization system protein ParE
VNYRLLIRRQAKSDLRQAVRWYEGQSPGLGREFVAEVEATLNRISDNPLQYQTIYREMRRAIPRKFPYGVFYRVEQDAIVVFAIVHLHRNPASWQDRQ